MVSLSPNHSQKVILRCHSISSSGHLHQRNGATEKSHQHLHHRRAAGAETFQAKYGLSSASRLRLATGSACCSAATVNRAFTAGTAVLLGTISASAYHCLSLLRSPDAAGESGTYGALNFSSLCL